MTDIPKDPSGPEDTAGSTNPGSPNPAPQVPATENSTSENPTSEYRTSENPTLAMQPGPQQTGGPYVRPDGFNPYSGTYYQPGTPFAAAPRAPKQPRGRAGLVVGCLVLGALVGGGAGGGVAYFATANQPVAQSSTSSRGAENITVNDAKNATDVTAVAAKVSPSVVTISVQGSQAAGTGSGLVLTSDGYVLTNTHVVTLDGAISSPKIRVTTNDGKVYSATVVGTDPTVDLAVIKMKGIQGLPTVNFGNSSKLNVGDQAIAIGAPLGLSGTVTSGIVSSLNRSIQIASSAAPKGGGGNNGNNGNNGQGSPFNFDLPGQPQKQQSANSGTISLPVVQTDAAINPGNSGGALLDSQGRVIGVNVAIASAGGSSSSGQSGSIGVGFAIPSNLAKRVSSEIMQNGKATHGLLGATVKDSTAATNGSSIGASIVSVTSGGAAAKAGLAAGDVVTNFNGVPITGATDLTAQVRFEPAGASTDLTFVHSGSSKTVKVTLGNLPQ